MKNEREDAMSEVDFALGGVIKDFATSASELNMHHALV